ncbi:hypothetical protein [endosymbiont GvMRE of Glomus versiforme]|uniref:hypothetical protein n=1 Tax=endosymbiont GvMRE of Glomus versiforme TaxID=2039283 RepID=UPI000ED36AEA|nr:hypothetical protein [endosymbiont GvMRE of Glomus versiforme]RHZ36347.1 hypothetical protein GvMRE_Ic1g52 [endosymbiont GvMRE of Glomus versiforme]RHZ37761.1 hypothetical protein GvMRE_I1g697 [endosymbiont GvMRE of Glomus versiforme]
MNYDPNFANDWLNKAREYNQVLTKPTYTKHLEKRIKVLEAGKGKPHKDLEDKLKEAQDTLATLYDFFNECGFDDFAQARTILNGKTVKEIVKKSHKKDLKINDLQTEINELEQEKTDLIQQANNLLAEKENQKNHIKQQFIQGKATGTTHWIYWKNWAETEIKKAQQEKAKLEKAEVNFLKKVGFDTYPNLEKGVKEMKELLSIYQKTDALSFFETPSEQALKVIKQHQTKLYYLFYSVGENKQELDLSGLSTKFDDTCLFFGVFGKGRLAVNFNAQQKAVVDLRTKRKPQELLGATKGKWFVSDEVLVKGEGK